MPSVVATPVAAASGGAEVGTITGSPLVAARLGGPEDDDDAGVDASCVVGCDAGCDAGVDADPSVQPLWQPFATRQ